MFRDGCVLTGMGAYGDPGQPGSLRLEQPTRVPSMGALLVLGDGRRGAPGHEVRH